MGSALNAAAPALALGGVLSACAAAALALGGERRPHLGAGALAGLAALLAARWGLAPVLAGAAAVVLTAGAGLVAGGLDARAGRRDAPPLLADAAVLGLLVGLGALARPPAVPDLPGAPLGGVAGVVPSAVAAVLGIVAAVVVLRSRAWPRSARWALAGAVLAGVMLPVAGLGAAGGLDPARVGVPTAVALTVADPFALALRGAAVGLLARGDFRLVVLVAFGLAAAETVLRSLSPRGDAGLVAVLAVLVAATAVVRARPAPAAT